MTPLPPIDRAAVEAFWARAVASGATPKGDAAPIAEYFGDHAELADELIGLVLEGRKRATCGAIADYEQCGDPIPELGGRWVALDGAGRPRAVLRTTGLRFGPFSSVEDDFAYEEGEGERTRADWLRSHTGFFARFMPSIGQAFVPDMPVVFQRFALDYRE